jgi:curved DNA-binding protein CbpA
MRDPFTVLGVADDAGDAEIRRRYLTLLREFPPDREPERFQEFRAAYEALSEERNRLATKLLHTNAAALTELSMKALRPGSTVGDRTGGQPSGGRPTDAAAPRATRQTVAALLAEGIAHSLADLSPKAAGKQGGQ